MVKSTRTRTMREPEMSIKRKAVTYYIFTCEVCGKEVRSDTDHPPMGVTGRFIHYDEQGKGLVHSFYSCSDAITHITRAYAAFQKRTEERGEDG
jgi:hypothetical protein